MFVISLLQNLSPNNQLDKQTNVILEVSGSLKEGSSIINPVIKIECNLENVAKCNYMFIPVFGRYYFITDIKSVTANIVEFSAHVDVLMTYRQEIKTNTGIVRVQENNWNLYLNDGTFKVYQNPMVLTKEFPTGFNTMEFVLAVAGS